MRPQGDAPAHGPSAPQTATEGAVQPPKLSGSSWRRGLPFFYGWVILGSVFIAQALAYGVQYASSVFFVALLEEFGWSRGPTAGVFSILILTIGLSGALAGLLVDRFGPPRIVAFGSLVLSLGLAATSQITEMWQLYLSFGVVTALGIALSGWVPCVAMVSAWFSAKRGLALGIAAAGIGLGIVGIVPFCQYLISNFGWRFAILALAVVVLVGIAPQALLLQIARPEELGLRPDGVSDAGGSATPRTPRSRVVVVDQKWASYPWSVATAMRRGRFWLLGGAMGLFSVVNQMLFVHQVAYLTDGGYDKMLAAVVVGLAGLVSIPAKILWGGASDRLGREVTFTMGLSTMLLAILLLVLTRSVPGVWLVFVFGVFFAVGYSASAPLGPAASADIFAGRRFGSIYGVAAMSMGIGGGLGTWLGGYLFDITGSYMAAFAAAAASSCASATCMWLAAPRKVRRVAHPGSSR